jgi:hypothetical protein
MGLPYRVQGRTTPREYWPRSHKVIAAQHILLLAS